MKVFKRGRGFSLILTTSLFLIISGFLLLSLHWVRTYNPGKLTISGPFGVGAYEFDRASLSEKELDIAWKLYVQLTTRKAAIPFDENDDIILEVYESWYQLFTSTRDYLMEMPARDLEGNKNAQQIVKLSIDVLNEGLRPHLTKWQGKYRKWYDDALKDQNNKNLTPQDIQRKYPHYKEIVADIKQVNGELVEYAKQLKKFSHDEPPSFSTKVVSNLKKARDLFN